MSERDERFSESLSETYEKERRLALEETNKWIETLSEEKRNTPCKSVGGRVFTPIEILHEIEKSTSFGRLFVNNLTQLRIYMHKREE
jgi:hypothetical protein